MTNKNKNRHTTIETKKSKSDVMSEIKTPEPTINDAISNALKSHSYLADFIKIGCDDDKMTIGDMVKVINDNKDSHAYKHCLSYSQYGQDPLSQIKIYKRLTGGFKHYSHLIKTDVKHKLDITKNGEIIKNTADISESCQIVAHKTV